MEKLYFLVWELLKVHAGIFLFRGIFPCLRVREGRGNQADWIKTMVLLFSLSRLSGLPDKKGLRGKLLTTDHPLFLFFPFFQSGLLPNPAPNFYGVKLRMGIRCKAWERNGNNGTEMQSEIYGNGEKLECKSKRQ